MKHNFGQHNQKRLDRSRELAAKARQKSGSLYKQAEQMASVIPPGQPVLVGHHSEKSDRNYRKRIYRKFDSAFREAAKAKYYDRRAEIIENSTAISSDDPEAIQKLEGKLKDLTESHEFMKKANVFIRKNDQAGFLALPRSSQALWDEVSTDRFGYKSFNLSNSSQNISSVKKRIEFLRKNEKRVHAEIEIKGVRLIENVEANRVQLIFPARLSKEQYKQIRHFGFIYCKSENAFQRKLDNYAVTRAKDFVNNHYL